MRLLHPSAVLAAINVDEAPVGILHAASEFAAAASAKWTPPRHFLDGKIGSTALGVVTNSWAPCLVVSRPMRLPLERVLVAVDLIANRDIPLAIAEYARQHHADLVVQ